MIKIFYKIREVVFTKWIFFKVWIEIMMNDIQIRKIKKIIDEKSHLNY